MCQGRWAFERNWGRAVREETRCEKKRVFSRKVSEADSERDRIRRRISWISGRLCLDPRGSPRVGARVASRLPSLPFRGTRARAETVGVLEKRGICSTHPAASMTHLSCTLLNAPSRTGPRSPLSTAPCHTEHWSATSVSPMSVALGAIHASAATEGTRLPSEYSWRDRSYSSFSTGLR